jgi:uncharacterized protein (TIGR02145 family)
MKREIKVQPYLIVLLLIFINGCDKNHDENIPIIDIEGNLYHTVTIGTQVWTVENLKTSHYNDGAEIPAATNDLEWQSADAPAYCWFNNDSATYANTYGALYNWYTIETERLCPTGWHVPEDSEWTTLIEYLGGDSIAGGKMKEIGTSHWKSPNTAASNSSGFSALPGGFRLDNGLFFNLGFNAYFMSSTEYDYDNGYAWRRILDRSFGSIHRDGSNKVYGQSVRCVKD